MVDIPKIKKKINAFLIGEEGKISKESLLKTGMVITAFAVGSAIAASVVGGAYGSFGDAQKAMCGVKGTSYKPIEENHRVYSRLFGLYKQLHDGFGVAGSECSISNVMKDLLEIKEQVNA